MKMTVDYFYAQLYHRLLAKHRLETLERHEARLAAAADKRHDAIYEGRRKWRAQYDRQQGRCALCGQPKRPDEMTRDHIVVSRAKNGGTDWDNIQLACAKCSETKGD